jgi:23S rRNA pseudouridine2605 synthase
LTSEQLEAARAERMRQNGLGALTFEDARTWIEETGLCLFLPRRQFSPSVAPSFVEAIAGQPHATPDPRQIAAAEELLVRLENEGIAVRLNLQGQPGEQPDYIVASWVLPYVYALRGDRDWRRSPQLTGSRAVSQLAVQTYKLLEAGEATIAQLRQALGREVSEAGVVRAITELWQQLRIIPVIAAPGTPAKWQLLRTRFQKAIAEGASTSQVTAISVLASIYLQAVIAASMEEVEIFLSPLTARSKVREVLRGLVATRQVHTISLGHAPHFYVAGTLPEFPVAPTIFANSTFPASSYYLRDSDHGDNFAEPAVARTDSFAASAAPERVSAAESHPPHGPVRKPASASKPAARFARSPHRERKPSTADGNRPVRRGGDARTAASRGSNGSRWSQGSAKSTNGKLNGHGKAVKSGPKTTVSARKARPESRTDARSARSSRTPALAASAKAGNSKRFGFTARTKQGTKKRG